MPSEHAPQRAPIPIQEGAFIRPLLPDDAEELFGVVDRNRERLRTWLAWVDGTQAPEDTLAFIESSLKAQGEGSHPYAVILAGRIVGVIGFAGIDERAQSAMIGYWNDAEVEGKGLITSATKAMLKIGFESFGFQRLIIRAQAVNTKSCAIPERLGFRAAGVDKDAEFLNGRWVDLKVYALDHADWSTLPS